MSVKVRLPTVLRRLADDRREVELEAATVGEAMQALAWKFPALGRQLLDETGALRPFVRVFVGEDDAQDLDGAETAVPTGATLRIVPAIAGGMTF